MKEYKDISSFFEDKGPDDVERFIDKNLDISQQIYALIKERGWTQKEFAKILGKTEPEISKWLSGTHNLTLRSIAKMESTLDSDIILTPLKAKKLFNNVQYITLRVNALSNKSLPDQEGYKEVKGGYSKSPEKQVLKIA